MAHRLRDRGEVHAPNVLIGSIVSGAFSRSFWSICLPIAASIAFAISAPSAAIADGATPAAPARLAASSTIADHTGTPPLPPREAQLAPPSAEPGVERPLPDYDQRPDPPATAGDVLIWVPRAVFLPVHLVLEYGVRRSLIHAIAFGEEHHLLGGPSKKGGAQWSIVPFARFESDQSPSAGARFFVRDFLVDGHRLTLRAGLWVDNWKHLAAESRWSVLDGGAILNLRADYLNRGDLLFHGASWNSDLENRSYLRFERFDVSLGFFTPLRAGSGVGVRARLRDADLRDGVAPRFSDHFDPADFNGFAGYQYLSFIAQGVIDTRPRVKELRDETGYRIESVLGYHHALDGSEADFLRASGEAAVFCDLGHRNVLSLSLYGGLIEKNADHVPPPPELFALGGSQHLRGFSPGRYRGESTAVAAIDYRYPIWVLMDAGWFVEVGNAFGPNYRDFGWNRLAFDFGFTLDLPISNEWGVSFLLAAGTDRFSEPNFGVEEVRVALAINHGF